ncbi:phycobilisome rod-core linker polypeptide [Synechococcus sp. CS-197]|uniref:phycobilisome rod-core linker polypeptide n=1 Tax=Synechococcus sp. CS-197 TaxID=2847985 RepID=UPI000152525B|nr:phycobilisome rod-core linker polypeptide [Synechococcus sp. CS-197]MCT0250089.1 phycobilisome rod-core linker polypeptide [Synechococcus sp. CS-197]CAK22931.1 Phycobilisome rod-core linker polypeptide cpcG (L-RC 28.5) [Synechococcus sp. WH 7803]
MSLPLLDYPLSTQNNRVANITSRAEGFNQVVNQSTSSRDLLIEKAYRQIYFHAMKHDRDTCLESQFRAGSITMRDFVRQLLLSERFQQSYYQCNSNYRMVDQVIGRVLGRSVHNDGERRAWSIVIGEKGFTAFVDALLESDEYMNNFGYDRVPEQRARVLPGQPTGEIPIYQQFPRYGADWRDSLQDRAPSDQSQWQQLQASSTWVNGQPPALALKIWLGIAAVGAFELGRVILVIAVSMLRT